MCSDRSSDDASQRGMVWRTATPEWEDMMERTPKILLVDDEPFISRAVATVLENAGFKVTTCEQWAGVASAVRTEEPDLVLLDYNMPMLKGDSICAILKRNGARPGMKIVLFSSESPSDLLRIAAECGADGWIPKNTAPTNLVQQIRLFVAGAA